MTELSSDWIKNAADGHRTLAEKAYAALREAIATGALAPGERLRIVSLASALGMSHLPIREAIRQLESQGLVEHVPHRGGRVAELSLRDLHELYDARLLVEPEVIRRSAEVFTADDTAHAKEAFEQLIAANRGGDPNEMWSAHTDFHFALYNPCGSSWLLRVVTPLWESSQRYRLTVESLSSSERRTEAQNEHSELLEACGHNDGDRAARVLRKHLVGTANLVAAQFGSEPLFAAL